MDHIGFPENLEIRLLRAFYVQHLRLISGDCAWTEGSWAFAAGPRKWNDVQNTKQDVALLTDHLQSLYDQNVRHPTKRYSD